MKALILLVVCLISVVHCVRIANGMKIENHIDTPLGPSYIEGNLGKILHITESSVRSFITNRLKYTYQLNPSIKFIFDRMNEDFAGMIHYHFKQQINDIPVQYSKIIIHINPITKEVYAVSADIIPGITLPSQPSFSVLEAKESITSLIPSLNFTLKNDIELVYLKLQSKANLVFQADVIYIGNEDGSEKRSFFYLDAVERNLVAEIPQYLNIRRIIVDYKTNAPVVARVEGTPPVAAENVNALYDNLGICYDYFSSVHGRLSYDGKDGILLGIVNVGIGYNNAYWDGNQNILVFGNGDGVNFSDLSEDLTVVCHELSHGVVQYTAGLIYQGESGALDEAFSDIFGFSASNFNGVDPQYRWMVAPDCYTPSISGDALRYMDNPTLDGISYDFYPGYQGERDYGGVHWNSGIANLAFVLAVDGGTHPQGKSNVVVRGIGHSDAEKIFYNVLDNYLTPNSNFVHARASTVTVARSAFGYYSLQAVTASRCWEAVGVPAPSGPLFDCEETENWRRR